MDDLNTFTAARHLQQVCHKASADAGWWRHISSGIDLLEAVRNPADPLTALIGGGVVTQKLCLIHSEISEAMEGHRKGLNDDKLPTRPMIEVELADAIIRICDLAGALQLDLGGAVADKMAYNAHRADHRPEHRVAAGGKTY
jgi:NTP pyrophosphatase (non-canonical NTP hydrolase)